MTLPTSRGSLWSVNDVTTLAVRFGFGAALVALAWVGASGSAELETQAKWVGLGVAGVIVSGVGAALFLLSGLRRVWRAIHSLASLPAAACPSRRRVEEDRTRLAADETDASTGRQYVVVSVLGVTKYHNASCPLVAGKSVSVGPAEAHEGRGLRRCMMCLP